MGRDRTFCGKLTQPFCQQTEFSKYISYNVQRTKFNPQVSLPPYSCLKQQRHSEVLVIGQHDVHSNLLCFPLSWAYRASQRLIVVCPW